MSNILCFFYGFVIGWVSFLYRALTKPKRYNYSGLTGYTGPRHDYTGNAIPGYTGEPGYIGPTRYRYTGYTGNIGYTGYTGPLSWRDFIPGETPELIFEVELLENHPGFPWRKGDKFLVSSVDGVPAFYCIQNEKWKGQYLEKKICKKVSS